jgi:DNA-binding NtrC family response regulator
LFAETFQRKGYRIDVKANGKEAMEALDRTRYDLVITDIRLPDQNGMKVLEKARKKHPDIGVIMITAYASIKNAVKAMKAGAWDYIQKPFGLDEIEIVVNKYFEFQSLVDENRYLRNELDQKFSFSSIIGSSPSMQKVFDSIRMVAKSRATVLLQGESGTGKELVARAIHYNSDRKQSPFITTNCAAMPEGLVESELFGHEKGAFTGAIRTTKGRFEMADGGTLLLDEISEISPALQAKLLRVLQEREIERVGSGKTLPVDVRIIATTNKDLNKEVESGRFRHDLFYRLNVVPIQLPSITERREDIPLLVRHFINKYAVENGRSQLKVSEKAVKFLCQRDWPGNVRELENAMERAVVMCPMEHDSLDVEQFFLYEKPLSSESRFDPPSMNLHDVEKSLILKALGENENNRTQVAEILGISVRTLRNKLNEYRREGIAV